MNYQEEREKFAEENFVLVNEIIANLGTFRIMRLRWLHNRGEDL